MTKLEVNGRSAPTAALAAGQRFLALVSGAPTDTLAAVVAQPALAVYAQTPEAPRVPRVPRVLYAFVGTVTGVDPGAGTVSIDVLRSLPAGLVAPGSAPVTLKLSPDTFVLGGTNGLLDGGLSNVSVGDLVAGGMRGDAGLGLDGAQALPLRLLLDLPGAPSGSGAGSGSGSAASSPVASRELRAALALLDGRARVSHRTVKRHAAARHRPASHHSAHRASRHSHH